MEIKNIIVGPISTNCYLLISEKEAARPKGEARLKEAAIIDPGDEAENILKEIKNSGNKIKYIILTHSHWDHTSGVTKIKDYNPPTTSSRSSLRSEQAPKTKAKILIHKAGENLLNFKIDKFLSDGEKIKIGEVALKVIHTPGHTKDSICLLGEGFIFTGDTLFKIGVGRTDLPGGSQKELEESLQKLSKILKPGMKVYPGHGEIFEYKSRKRI